MFLRLSVGLRKGTRMQRMNYLIFLIVFLCCKTYASNAILHKEKCHFCLNYSLTFAFRSYSGPNCATNKKNGVFVAFERKKTSMLINWLAFYIDCVWQCAKSDKRERKKAIDSNSNETMYRTTRSMVLAIVCIGRTRKKTLAFSFVHSTATDHSRQTRNSNCNRFFFTLDNNRKKFGEKKNAAKFFLFRLLILKANCWRQ